VYVLEGALTPVSIYDIQRGIERELGRTPPRSSLNVSVANDRRCCWAGKGVYGLYRHGFIPGPRRLLDVARVVLLAHGDPLDLDELSFVMKHVGYRFQDQSLASAVTYGRRVQWDGWRRVRVNTGVGTVAELRRELGIAPRKAGVEAVLARTRGQVEEALAVRSRRLRAVRRGLPKRDPIHTDRSQSPHAL
jgi:hypothetical protein